MEHIELVSRDPLISPVCDDCGSHTRLVGLEPHPIHQRVDVCTYQCSMCAAVQTRDIARAPFQRRGAR